MGMILLGLRNLFRSRLRLAIVVVLIAVPFFLLLVMQAIGDAIQSQTEVLKRDVNTLLQLRARGSMGHINMVRQDRILPQDVLDKVNRIEHVVHVEPYLLAMAPITEPNFVMHVGLEPTAEKRLESHGEAGNPRIIAGRDFTPNDRGKDVAIIGQGYAKWAGITQQDIESGRATLVVDATRSHPVIFPMNRPSRTLKIIGMYASGYVFGDLQLFMPLDTFRDFYGVYQGISWVFVRVDSVDNAASVTKRLQEVVGDVADILAPKGAAVFTVTTSRTVTRLAIAGATLAVVLMTIVIFFVTLMQVRERSREIGTLKAIGASDGRVTVEVLTEAIAITILGGLVALILFKILGETITGPVFAFGITPFLPSHYKPLVQSLSVANQISASGLGVLAFIAFLASVLGSAYGLWQVVKLSPLEAMRHE
jgi:ABC-type antimicrobial peptide transport system permease subunit